ncbi:hypothetical protein A4X13_0g5188 [Tilletia indica]|uniref:Ndc10 domain-containing protein n=1 Tax=Tilletia indica TaxID=43049 RepID=A0A177TP27_9BASI|nr:hypothetical protein A4X13_0g5188 [Tilletia indica]
MGIYLFERFHLSNEAFPSFARREDWYDTWLIRSTTDPSKQLPYRTQYSHICKVLGALNIQSSKKTHLNRGGGARRALDNDASEAQILRAGRSHLNSQVPPLSSPTPTMSEGTVPLTFVSCVFCTNHQDLTQQPEPQQHSPDSSLGLPLYRASRAPSTARIRPHPLQVFTNPVMPSMLDPIDPIPSSQFEWPFSPGLTLSQQVIPAVIDAAFPIPSDAEPEADDDPFDKPEDDLVSNAAVEAESDAENDPDEADVSSEDATEAIPSS